MSQRKTVLVVEADSRLAETFERQLSMAGHDAVVQERGAAALEWLQSGQADLIVLEAADTSTWYLSRWIRENVNTRFTPLIVLTGPRGENHSGVRADLYLPRSLAPTKLPAMAAIFLADLPVTRRATA